MAGKGGGEEGSKEGYEGEQDQGMSGTREANGGEIAKLEGA
jgi:hypothetical protein